jgi:hypothetical protein
MNITILFWVMFIIGMLCGFVITVMWDTPISCISNNSIQEEKTYHSDSYMNRYPFEPNFIDVNTSVGYIHSVREGGTGPITQWTVPIEFAVAGGTGPSTQWNAPIEFGPSTQWTVPTNITKLDLYVAGDGELL